MKTLFTFLLLVVITGNWLNAQNVGDIAPDFSLDDINNQKFTLSENRGSVILVFLVGYNCSLCIASAPTVKSTVVSPFINNSNFKSVVIDTWDGTLSGVKSFQSTTGIQATYLQKGSNVASSWDTTYDRLVVIDSEGKMVFKGTRAARSDADNAKVAIENALNNITTSVNLIDATNGFALGQNYPNPAANSTTVEFSVGKASEVTLSVLDITGKKILVPVQQFFQAGNYEVTINDLKKGIYFYRLEANNFVFTKKMTFQ